MKQIFSYIKNITPIRILSILIFIALSCAYGISSALSSPYQPAATNDPACAPGDTNCFVQIIPSQTSNSGKLLTTDGTQTSWTNTPNIGTATGSSLNLGSGTLTSGLINGQTISSAANFTGSVTGGAASFTTGAFSGVITSNITSGTLLNVPTISGNQAYFHIGSTATDVYLGQASSVGANPFSVTAMLNNATFYGNKDNVPLQLVTTALPRLTIDGSGNIGIGTTSPGVKLQIGDFTQQNTLRVTGSATANQSPVAELFRNGIAAWQQSIDVATGNLNIGQGSQNAYADATLLSNAKLTIGVNGNVGIGTTSPDNTYLGLTIYGSNPSLRLKGSGVSAWDWIEYATSAGVNNFSTGVNQSVPYYGIKAGAGLDNPSLAINTAGDVALGGAFNGGTFATASMVVKANGNVGIGTTSPGFKLEVDSAVAGAYTTSSAQAGLKLLNVTNAGGINSSAIIFQASTDGMASNPIAQVGVVGESAGTNLGSFVIMTRDAGAITERMRVNSSGNVGIGTTSPAGTLDVYRTNDGGNSLSLTYPGGIRYDFVRSASTGALSIQGTQTGANNIVLAPTSGNVGIGPGASSPSQLLTVAQNSVAADSRVLLTNNNNAHLQFLSGNNSGTHGGGNAGNTLIDFRQNHDLLIGASTDEALTARANYLTIRGDSGNVGVGTINPAGNFEVRKDTAGAATIVVVRNLDNTNAASNARIALATGGLSSGDPYMSFDNQQANGWALGMDTSDSSKFKLDYNTTFTLGTGNILTAQTNGDISIGSTADLGKLAIIHDGAVAKGIYINNTNATTTGQFVMQILRNSVEVGSIVTTNTATTYVTSSDQRLKENIQPTHYTLADLMNIQVSDYSFIKDDSHTIQNGFIAQQLATIYPDAVHVGGDDPATNPWAVDYGRLTPLIVKSIQEMDIKVTDLTSLDISKATSLGSLMKQFLADAGNSISLIITDTLQTKNLCVADDSGAKTCLTKAQLDTLIHNAYSSSSSSSTSSTTTTTSTSTTTTSTTPLDTTPPVITLSGPSSITITLGTTYTDAGATATDNIDTTVHVATVGTVDTGTLGTYTLTYTATDLAGNNAIPVTRTVIVTAPTTPTTTP